VTGVPIESAWLTCDDDGDGPCTGVRSDGFDHCLAHLTPEQLGEALSRLQPGANLDVRGTTVSEELLRRILEAVNDDDRHPTLGQARFDGVTFSGDASFEWATFTAAAWFDGAVFAGDVKFDSATFTHRAWFRGAVFAGDVRFDMTTFHLIASFDKATFKTAKSLSLVSDSLELRGAEFTKRVVIEASAGYLACNETRFESGVVLRLRHVDADFEHAAFGAPSAITSANEPRSVYAERVEQRVGLPTRTSPTPRLVSLHGVDVADLVITDVDLGQCRFSGAHHLDKLRLEGDCTFARTPKRAHFGWAWPPVWRWTRRQVLAEECERRVVGRRSVGWPDSPAGTRELNAKRVAALYRDLRKAQEDSKNEPGAADFYYGEMEMRRTDPTAGRAERLILFLYWLTSGYGLRATRALSCLAVLIAMAAVAFHSIGFEPPSPGLGTSLLYAAQSTVSLESKLAGLPFLTWQGETLRLIMRLLGPLLLGLALLAVRNRVKR
jgi:hypothetical protein